MDREDIRQAILHERERREYSVVVDHVRTSYGIAGIRFPAGIEAYTAEVTCTVHESPCFWIDWAFVLPGGNIRVVTMGDLVRPGMMVEESVRMLIEELTHANAN